MEKKCPGAYFDLPDPESALAPYDNELNYFMWGPGFEWQPEPVEDSMSSVEETYEESEQSEEEGGNLSDKVSTNEAKKLFDSKAKGGKISIQEASENARKLKLAPSSSDEEKAKAKYGDSLNYKQYTEYLSMCMHENDNAVELARIFANFDISGKGYLTKKQMRNILTTWGDALTDKEAAEILDSFSNDDKIDYNKFCEHILQ